MYFQFPIFFPRIPLLNYLLLFFIYHILKLCYSIFSFLIPETDHQGAVQRHCDHLMEFQGKMVEACRKFESMEEEHLAQMVTFMAKIAQVCPFPYIHVSMTSFQLLVSAFKRTSLCKFTFPCFHAFEFHSMPPVFQSQASMFPFPIPILTLVFLVLTYVPLISIHVPHAYRVRTALMSRWSEYMLPSTNN